MPNFLQFCGGLDKGLYGNHFTLLKHIGRYLAHLCLNNGKCTEILDTNKKPTGMAYYILSHDYGRVFAFVNNNDTLSLDEYITFNMLENLRLTSADKKISDGRPFWKFEVAPKNKVFKQLRIEKSEEGSNISYTCHHEFLKPGDMPFSIKERASPETLNDSEILEIVKKRGSKSPIRCPKSGRDLNISYFSKYINPYYAFCFENNEDDVDFEGKFAFKLKNLILDKSDISDDSIWNIKLNHKSKPIVRKILPKNKNEGISMSYSIDYQINNSKL